MRSFCPGKWDMGLKCQIRRLDLSQANKDPGKNDGLGKVRDFDNNFLLFSACARVNDQAGVIKTARYRPLAGLQRFIEKCKYVDSTHTITPTIPVWKGFGKSKFGRTVDPETGKALHVRKGRL